MLDRVIETDCDTIEEPCRRGGPAARERLSHARVLVVGLEPWGIVAATDEEKAKSRKIATLASRTNFALSIPMLACMAGQSHGLPF